MTDPSAATAPTSTPASSGGVWDTIKNFFSSHIYSSTDGIRTGAASPLILAGIGGLVSGWNPLVVAGSAAAGLAVSPLIASLLEKIGTWLGISRLPNIPGGIPRVPSIPIGQASPPLDTHPAPVVGRTPGEAPSDTIVRSPALERIRVPVASVNDAVAARRRATERAVALANLPADGRTTAAVKEEVESQWREVNRQERSIADFVATMERYGREQQEYMSRNGERARLITTLAERTGRPSTEIEALVPRLPPLPANYRAVQAPAIANNYQAAYNDLRAGGRLPEEYRNKSWAELDPLMKISFAYNQANIRVAVTKADIDVSKLVALNRNGFLDTRGWHPANTRQPIAQLGAPDFVHMDKWNWRNAGVQNNCALCINSRLLDNPDGFCPEAGYTHIRISEDIRTYANHARNWIQNHGRGHDTEGFAEYGKVLEYCNACAARRELLAAIENMHAPVQVLEGFRNNEMTRARTQVETFLQTTLPDLNGRIEERRRAPAPAVTPLPASGATASVTPTPGLITMPATEIALVNATEPFSPAATPRVPRHPNPGFAFAPAAMAV